MAIVLILTFAALAATPALASHEAGNGHAVLYFHAADGANLSDIPLNLLAPPDSFTFRSSDGPGAATFTCADSLGGPRQEAHSVHAFTYAAATEDELLPQGLNVDARGLAYPTTVAGSMSLRWYLETTAGGPGPDGPPVPNVVVRATVREGAQLGGPALYDAGNLIAEGQSAPVLLAGPATQGVTTSQVEGRTVYNFTVPLEIRSPQLPERGFNVRVDVFLDNPLCGAVGGTAMGPLVRLHNSPGHRPTLSLDVGSPLRIVEAEVRESQAGIVHLRTGVVSVWGPYAVENLTVDVQGPSQASATTMTVVYPDGPATRPGSPTYLFWNWDALSQGAIAGDYTLTFAVRDHAGNDVGREGLPFRLEEASGHLPDPDRPAAAFGLSLAVFALALAVARAHRRT